MLSTTLILFLILAIAICCFAAELPRNAYLPPFRSSQGESDDEVASFYQGHQGHLPLGRYAPIFLDFPAVQDPLRQQQEYALDLPFEEKPLEFGSIFPEDYLS